MKDWKFFKSGCILARTTKSCFNQVTGDMGNGKIDGPTFQDGTLHQARWMQKTSIDSRWLSSSPSCTTYTSLTKIKSASVAWASSSIIYAKYWHEALISMYTLFNDHHLASVLKQYPGFVPVNDVLNALHRYLWYLSEDHTGMGLFNGSHKDTEGEDGGQSLEAFKEAAEMTGWEKCEPGCSSQRLHSLWVHAPVDNSVGRPKLPCQRIQGVVGRCSLSSSQSKSKSSQSCQ